MSRWDVRSEAIAILMVAATVAASSCGDPDRSPLAPQVRGEPMLVAAPAMAAKPAHAGTKRANKSQEESAVAAGATDRQCVVYSNAVEGTFWPDAPGQLIIDFPDYGTADMVSVRRVRFVSFWR